ncbi:MAG: hypothetical protein GX891_04820 [Clostridiales bacterium]|nr:hypothetical protein [Clostridiales bacterium]
MKRRLFALALVLTLALFAFVLTACNDEPPSAVQDKIPNLTILYEQDSDMLNTYSMIAVSPDAPFNNQSGAAVKINTSGADAFINWMSLASTRELIKNYGYSTYGDYLFYLLEDAPTVDVTIPNATAETKVIRLSTTTSVNDSGLMDYLVPVFENTYGYDVQIYSAGTGAAINAAKAGNADLILVHSKSQEEAFVNAGFGRVVSGFDKERVSFMYNFFVLVGPTTDPAGVKEAPSVKDAFNLIAEGGYKFISRGDGSGTHTKELTLWPKNLGITSDIDGTDPLVEDSMTYEWYVSAGQGMGACLMMANEKNAYVLSDKATYLAFKNFVEK